MKYLSSAMLNVINILKYWKGQSIIYNEFNNVFKQKNIHPLLFTSFSWGFANNDDNVNDYPNVCCLCVVCWQGVGVVFLKKEFGNVLSIFQVIWCNKINLNQSNNSM